MGGSGVLGGGVGKLAEGEQPGEDVGVAGDGGGGREGAFEGGELLSVGGQVVGEACGVRAAAEAEQSGGAGVAEDLVDGVAQALGGGVFGGREWCGVHGWFLGVAWFLETKKPKAFGPWAEIRWSAES